MYWILLLQANHKFMDTSRVYNMLCECLCLVYELCPPIAETFSQKLIQVNFIPFVLSVKLKFQ